MVWAIRFSYKFEAVEVVKETAQMVVYAEHGRGKSRETRQLKDSFTPWRGDESTARSLVEKLNSARAECDRRRAAASEWFIKRRDEILASGMEAPSGGETENTGSTEGDSPTGEAGDAQGQSDE